MAIKICKKHSQHLPPKFGIKHQFDTFIYLLHLKASDFEGELVNGQAQWMFSYVHHFIMFAYVNYISTIDTETLSTDYRFSKKKKSAQGRLVC